VASVVGFTLSRFLSFTLILSLTLFTPLSLRRPLLAGLSENAIKPYTRLSATLYSYPAGVALKWREEEKTMSAIASKIAHTSLVGDPKQTFESAIAQIQKSGQKGSQYRSPIGMRRRAAVATQVGQVAEKQAVTDAARALAHLWHVSPTLVR
jgi:hypothetical protein